MMCIYGYPELVSPVKKCSASSGKLQPVAQYQVAVCTVNFMNDLYVNFYANSEECACMVELSVDH